MRLASLVAVLLENTRFYKEETKNDAEFGKKFAAPYDMFVNDAFGTAHRAHASTEGVTKHLSPSVAGFLLAKELEYLDGAVNNGEKPMAAIVGGSKVSSKVRRFEERSDDSEERSDDSEERSDDFIVRLHILASLSLVATLLLSRTFLTNSSLHSFAPHPQITVLETLLDKCDKVIIGGGMVFTFLKAKGLNVGSSLVEDDFIETAKKVRRKKQAPHS